MRVPLAWLRDYVDVPADVAATVATLARLGFPVETVETRPTISGVVVGTIVALAKHPNADRLQVCTIDVGAPATLTIATAATNVAAGQIVPVALIGAQLPQLTIAPRTMRGIDSQGMLCSAEELALPAEWFEDGIMQLDDRAANGTDVVQLFGLDLPILDVEIGANRGDALSLVGIARELAAATRSPLRFPTLAAPPTDAGEPASAATIDVALASPDVRRYVAVPVEGLRVLPAPTAIRIRLALAGQRPINNLVDISNFVMLELGQPLHFFDAERIADGQIIVRDARDGELLTTLDGIERRLDPTALVIADAERATGLAGLMGGMVSEVSASTRAILIESANFAGPRIRRMSVKLGLRTEASTRNEKNLAPALTDLAAARAVQLLDGPGVKAGPARTYGQPLSAPFAIHLRAEDIERLLGLTVDDDEIIAALESLGFTVAREAQGAQMSLTVTVPAWRTDVHGTADLVEEVARIVGYDRVRAELPPTAPQDLDSTAFEREMAIARTLASLGYAECMTLGLQPRSVAERWRETGIDVPPVVEIINPLSEDQRWMRFSILPALLDHARRERSVRPLRTFEIGHIFADAAPAPRETNVVTLLATSKPRADAPAWRDELFLAVAAEVRALVRAVTGTVARLERGAAAGMHPGKCARILAGETAVGFVGSVDPRLLRAADLADDAVAATLFIDELPAPHVRHYRPVSKYPALERDLAIVVDVAVNAADVIDTIRAASPIARRVDIFDEYRGPQIGAGKKSLGVRIALQRDDATLTDGEADAALQRILGELRDAHGAVVRG